MNAVSRPRSAMLSLAAVTVLSVGWTLFGLSCPGDADPGSGDGGTGFPIPDATVVTVLAPTASETVIAGAEVSVEYAISNPPAGLLVTAFLERTDAPGVRAAMETGLSSTGGTVRLQTAGVAPGTYFPTVQISDSINQVSSRATTPADQDVIITVRGQGEVSFSAPGSSGPFEIGRQIDIAFDLGSAGTAVNYRVFFDNDGVLNGNESIITIGRGTSGQVTWDTTGLPADLYFIGISIENEGVGLTEYLPFPIRLDEAPAVQVTAPAANRLVRVIPAPEGPEVVDVRVSVRDRDSRTEVVVFLDNDQSVANGVVHTIKTFTLEAGQLLQDELIPLEITDELVASAPPAVYFIGASATELEAPENQQVAYAAGRLEILGGDKPAIELFCVQPDLTASSCPVSDCATDSALGCPSASEDRLQNLTLSDAEGLRVVWKAFDGNSLRITTRLYLDPDRFPLSGNEILLAERVDTAGPLSAQGCAFCEAIGPLSDLGVAPGQVYNYLLVINDAEPVDTPDGAPITVYASSTLAIKARNLTTRWLGDVGGDIPGARILGEQPGDRLGSLLMPIGDRNGDGRDDYAIAAQYGDGVGIIRLVFGSSSRLVNRELPFVGLPGRTFTGVEPRGADPVTRRGGDTLGLVDFAIVPDLDFDGLDEFMFALPHADALPQIGPRTVDPLAAPGHFLAGGVVVYSSRNGGGGADLGAVGRIFNCEEGDRCDQIDTCDNLWLPDDDPEGLCFDTPLARLQCINDTPDCPCTVPGVDLDGDGTIGPGDIPPWTHYPGQWPGGVADDDWTGDDVLQGQLRPYGARILGSQTLSDSLEIDCDDDGTPDDPANYSANPLVFDPSGRFGSLIAPANDAFSTGQPILIVDPTFGRSGAVHRIDRRNYWFSRLEIFVGDVDVCIWGTPDFADPDAPTCQEVMDFGIPRPHQYTVAPRSRGAALSAAPSASLGTIIGPPGSEIATAAYCEIDGEPRRDIVVGAPGDDNGGITPNAGAIYILLGKDLVPDADLAEITDDNIDPIGSGTLRGTKIIGEAGHRLGEVQPRVGDVNGDSKPDLVLGIPRANRVVVIFGGLDLDDNGRIDLVERASPATNPWTITSLINAGLAVSFEGINSNDETGYTTTIAGDLDGDGLNDILVSAPGADGEFTTELTQRANPGDSAIFVASDDGITRGAFVNLGGESLEATFVDPLTDPNSGIVTIRVSFKTPVSNAHAVGTQVTVRLADSGKVFVIFGRSDLRAPVGVPDEVFSNGRYDLAHAGTRDLPATIYVGRKAGDRIGGRADRNEAGQGARNMIAAPGDVDGDGHPDLLIGAPAADPVNRVDAGEVYLIYLGP